MADPLWQKKGVDIDARIMRFLAGSDVRLDAELLTHDIAASKAHVGGLARIGVLEPGEAAAIADSLDALDEAFASGGFVLDQRYEDGHSAIEAWLVEQLGDVGAKVHAGRSRNDQVLVATRLYLKASLGELAGLCAQIAQACLSRAHSDRDVPMPGYTHLQRAVVSSAGTWFAGFAEAFVDNAALALITRDWIDANPLGTAAGYGVNLPLDRNHTTAELGFARMQINPVYTQNSRGKFELQALSSAAQATLDLRRLAWDLSLFTSGEFDFVTLPARFTTGSSIMPQKRNPDLVELLRAAHGRIEGAMTELQSVLSLPSGYHRDLQATKEPMLRGMRHALDALALVPDLVASLELSADRMKAAIEPSMYSTDRAIELSASGVPFREAYRQVADELDSLGDKDPAESIRARVSAGAPGNLCLDALAARLAALPLC